MQSLLQDKGCSRPEPSRRGFSRQAIWRGATLLLCLAAVVGLAGCLPTYVGDPATAKLDNTLLGIWHRSSDQSDELWLAYDLDHHAYLITAARFETGEDGQTRLLRTDVYRGWLATVKGQTFLSLQSYRPVDLARPDDPTTLRYVVARLQRDGDTITLAGVAPDFVKAHPVATPAELEKLIADHLDDPALLLEGAAYTHADATKPPLQVKVLLDLMNP